MVSNIPTIGDKTDSSSKPLFNQGNPFRILKSISVINRSPKLRLIKKFKINNKTLSNYKLIIVHSDLSSAWNVPHPWVKNKQRQKKDATKSMSTQI